MASKINWPKTGQLLCVLGAIMTIGAIVEMGLSIRNRPTVSCPAAGAPPPADSKATVFAPPGQTLTVNGAVCVAVRTKAYFGTVAAQPTPTQPPAPATPAAPQPAAPPAPVAGAPTVDAQATAMLAIFIDDERAPVTFAVPRASPEEWTWKRVELLAPDNATGDGAATWRKILAGPTRQGARTVKIGIGDAKAEAPRALAGQAVLRVYRPERFWIIGIGLASVLGGAIMWGWRTGMLRDRAPTEADPNPPFSLGRSQMAFWFLLTLAGYLYIWLLTNQSLNVFSTDALVLLGVSGATGLAAIIVDDGDAPIGSSKGYWTDILSEDGGGIVIHRLQMVAWTAVLGLLFVWSVVSAYEFRSFGTNLLVLSGIAGATYVGFKTREPTAPPA
jgi:hypothetical protein